MKKLVLLTMVTLLCVSAAQAGTILFSNSTGITLNSVTYEEGDLIEMGYVLSSSRN